MAQQSLSKNTTQKEAPKPRSLITSMIIGVILFGILFLALEAGSRTTWFNHKLPIRSLGIYHTQFEIKWFKLKEFVRENGGVDVLLLGNSMVNTGINPEVLAREYQYATGEKLRIFNFGVEGLTVAPNSTIARMLVEQYHPGTIVFVTEMRDYVAKNGLEVEEQLLADEWLAAQDGKPDSARVWLKSNSTALQNLLPFRNWSRFDFLDNFLMSIRRFGDTTTAATKQTAMSARASKNIRTQMIPKKQKILPLFKDFSMDPGRLADLKAILDFSKAGTAVFVTEMPLYPTYFDYFGGESVHAQYLSTIEAFVTTNSGVFLSPLSWELIPLEDRVDNHHLNNKGAPLFSRLLADQIAEACLNSGQCLRPTPVAEGVE